MTVVANSAEKVKETATRLFTGRKTGIVIIKAGRRLKRDYIGRVGTTKKRTVFYGASIASSRDLSGLIGATLSTCKGVSVLIGGTKMNKAATGVSRVAVSR